VSENMLFQISPDKCDSSMKSPVTGDDVPCWPRSCFGWVLCLYSRYRTHW